jgi:hypothetical protein
MFLFQNMIRLIYLHPFFKKYSFFENHWNKIKLLLIISILFAYIDLFYF